MDNASRLSRAWTQLDMSGTPWWRVLLIAVLLYLCVEGIVSLVFYEWKIVLLIKDILLSITYALFTVWATARRPHLGINPLVIVLLGVFVGIAAVELLNPDIENLLVALIGIRTRLFYIPLLLLGYYYIWKKHDLVNLGLLLVVSSIPVNLFALIQYLLGPERISEWGSGFAASVWTVGDFGGAGVYRPVATFSSAGHYASYLLAISLLTAAFCVCKDVSPVIRSVFRIGLGLQLVGVMINGARLDLLFVPSGILVIWLVPHIREYVVSRQILQFRPLVLNVGILVFALIIGWIVAPSGAYRAGSIIAPSEYRQLNILDTLIVSADRIATLSGRDLLLGHGLGTASPGSRYVIADPASFVTHGLLEGLVGQLVWEMGLGGILSFLALWLVVLILGVRTWLGLRDSQLQPIVVAILVYNLFLVATAGTYTLVAYSPTSVYYWFLIGVLMGLSRLDVPLDGPA